jgi:hypothetical protein
MGSVSMERDRRKPIEMEKVEGEEEKESTWDDVGKCGMKRVNA